MHQLEKALLPCLVVFALAACSDDDIMPQDSAPKDAAPDVTKKVDLGPGDGLVDAPVDITPDMPPDAVPADTTVDQRLLEAGADLIPSIPDLAAVPAHAKCKGAQKITLTAGAANITGSTTYSVNEFGTGVTCGTGYDYDGPQVYYSLPVVAGKGYRVELNPKKWDGALYAFTDVTCTALTITGQCATQLADDNGKGAKEVLMLAPAKTGDITLAVDSFSGTNYGDFTLTVSEFTPDKASVCATATSAVIGTKKVTLSGDTSKSALDENGSSITCGMGTALKGPQIYHNVAMSAGAAYSLSLTPQFDATLYVFPASYCGVAASIQLSCSGTTIGTGTVLGPISAGSTGSITFKPKSTENYIIAVDSASVGQAGAFTLEMQAVTPKNNTCSAPESLAFTNGVATATGDNTLASPGVMLPASGCTKTALNGGDMFYSANLTAGQSYLITLYPSSTLDGALYVSTSCSATGATCVAGVDTAAAGKPEKVVYTPTTTGTYIVGVGSRYKPGTTFSQGAFILGIETYSKPSNTLCSTPKSLSWSGTKASETGNTAAATNEFGGATCGGTVTFAGPQLYYSVLLTGGKKYIAKVSPAAAFDPAIYAFPATTSCSTASVNAACKGHMVDNLYGGGSEALVLAPTTSGSWILAVDSATSTAFGPFTITVEELPPVGNDTCASATGLGFSTGMTTITAKGQTLGATNIVSLASTSCTGGTSAGPDVFYKLMLEAQKTYKIKVDGSGFDELVYVLSNCGSGTTCYAGADKSASAAEELVITPPVTQVYYIGVDGKGATDTGTFTLTVEQTPSVCPSVTAITFTGGTAAINGTTSAEANSVSLPAKGCAGTTTPGPDLFLSAVLTQGKTYTITLKPAATFDPVFYLFGDCKAPATSCLKASALTGGGKTETIKFSPPATGTYYLGVDAATTTGAGFFTINIQ